MPSYGKRGIYEVRHLNDFIPAFDPRPWIHDGAREGSMNLAQRVKKLEGFMDLVLEQFPHIRDPKQPALTAKQRAVLDALDTKGGNGPYADVMDVHKIRPPWKGAPKTYRECTRTKKFNDKISIEKCRIKKQLIELGHILED